MARRGDVYGGDFIKASRQGTLEIKEFPNQTNVVLTIKGKLKTHEFEDGGSQRVCNFYETEQTFGLNATNWDAVAAMTGRDDDDLWEGTKVELFVIPMAQSKSGHAVRIRRPNIGQPGVQPQAPVQQANPVAQPAGVDPPIGSPSDQALISKINAVGATRPGVNIDTLKAHLAAKFPAQFAILAQPPALWPRSFVPEIQAWIKTNEQAAPGDIPF